MKVCVFGLWHLGTVTAACLADQGHSVTGLDFDDRVVQDLQHGIPPLLEPGLQDLVQKGLASNHLQFTSDPHTAISSARVIWVTFDTPVDDEDRADANFVIEQVERIFSDLSDGALVIISSQLPVGSTAALEAAWRGSYPEKTVSFAYSPENLRLGQAIRIFTKPDRVVVGVRNEENRETIVSLLENITERIEWMSVESAEMTKHALNAFLAVSVTFINEVAALCEQVGADAREVERGLKSESRIGPGAYLKPGAAFAGGTLARDVAFLKAIGDEKHVPVKLISSVATSNEMHKLWAYRRLRELLGVLAGKVVVVLGLTYKPGTDTLRRSSAVELCRHLVADGVHVRVHDPAVTNVAYLPPDLKDHVELFPSPQEALRGADAVVVATEWPIFRTLPSASFIEGSPDIIVLDANGFLAATFEECPAARYYAVGML